MSYRPKAPLDMEAVHETISCILKSELHDFMLRFEETGYSGRVYQLAARDQRGAEHVFLLKGVEDATEYRFYKDVLEPYGLSSPVMYGIVEAAGDQYLLMEYIPHEPPDWSDIRKYERAIDWLAFKDRVCEEHLPQIAELGYIGPFDVGPLPERVAAIRRAYQQRLDPCFSKELIEVMEAGRQRFREAARWVRRGPQTLTHNDFQMLNILFGTGRAAGQLYVVDWTYPAVGTVCIDLATLLHVAPPEHRSALIRRYRRGRPVPNFRPVYAAARVHVNLAILQWMIDALRTGHGHTIHRPKLQEAVNQLIAYFKPETSLHGGQSADL